MTQHTHFIVLCLLMAFAIVAQAHESAHASTLTPSSSNEAPDRRSSTSPLSCTADWQCVSVSQSYNYVHCVSGTCACATSQGFEGNATLANPCSCPSSRGSVNWAGAVPYCIDFPTCAADENAFDRTEILKGKIRKLYEYIMPPYPALILSKQMTVTDIFSQNLKGRIDPLGTFDDFASLTEYFYAFAANPLNYVSALNFVDLIGAGNEVFVRIDITFSWLDNSTGLPPFNLTESGRFRFDDNNLVTSADLIAHNIGKAVASLGIPTDTYIQNTCGILTVSPATCPEALDPSGFYTSFADCYAFMSSMIPTGTIDQASSNSFWCRFLHTLLTLYDPVPHCPHAGKTGGGKCVDSTYRSYYDVSY